MWITNYIISGFLLLLDINNNNINLYNLHYSLSFININFEIYIFFKKQIKHKQIYKIINL